MEYGEFNSINTSLVEYERTTKKLHTMSIDEDGTTVEVTFQYNKMRGTASGNLIVILLDINGQPLEKQQSCTKQDGLLELSNERSATQSFTFM